MKKFIVQIRFTQNILPVVLFFILYFLFSPIGAQDYFGEAQWIGAITREDAKIPEGRHYSGNFLKETKAEWDKPSHFRDVASSCAVRSNLRRR